jgi:hypothetical protein
MEGVMEKVSVKNSVGNYIVGALAVAYLCAGWVVGMIVITAIKLGRAIAQKATAGWYSVSKKQLPY